MASLKGFLGKLIFPELGVTKAEVITASFRRLTLAGASLTKLAPGDKIQVSLAEGTRTYTPFAFDAAKGSLDLLVYSHGDTPGAKWGRAVAEADRVNVFGPRGSIAIAALAGPVVVFGDETSSRARPATRTSTSSTRSFALAPAAPSTSRVRRSRSRDSALASRRSLRSPHRR